MEEQKPIQDITVVQPDDMPPPEIGQIDDPAASESENHDFSHIEPAKDDSNKDQGPIIPTKPTGNEAKVTLKPKAKSSQKTLMVVLIVVATVALVAISLLAYSKSPHS